jgi:hypothetical protein
MTTNNNIPSIRRRLSVAAMLAAAAAGALGLVPSAHAEPNNGGEWDIQTYDNCLDDWALNNPVGRPGDPIPQSVVQQCCAKSGGVWVIHGSSGKCEAQPAAGSSTPQPGATVILPPDAGQTQLGPTQPPPATANLHPGLNTRAGIQ